MDFALGILWVEEEDREREIYNSVAVTRSFGNNVHKYRVFVVHRNEQLAQNQEQKDFVILSFSTFSSAFFVGLSGLFLWLTDKRCEGFTKVHSWDLDSLLYAWHFECAAKEV